MRIAVDTRELHGKPTGVGRVLAGILDAWQTLPAAAAHEFALCGPVPVDTRGPQFQSIARSGWANSTLWEQLTLPQLVRETRADVLFAPGYSGPLRSPVPMVTAVYDVSFAAHPEWFGAREGFRRRFLTTRSAQRAARIITSSAFSRQEIERYLGVDSRRVEVVYPGVQAAPVSAMATRENLVLFVGSIFARRHVPELIDGFGRLARTWPDIHLEIVGDNRTSPQLDVRALANASGAGARIAIRSYVDEAALASLYARARAFVFLSEYEGFGLTPLEALTAGVPIVVLDTPVAREIYQDAAIYVAEPEPSLIHTALQRVLTDENERARILAAAAGLLPRYSWAACGAHVLRILEEAAG